MIPKRLHRIWLGDKPMPTEYADYWAEWKRLHPSWKLKTWTDSDLQGLRNHDLLKRVHPLAGASDLLRYEVLMRYGGVYVDCDMEPLRPLDPLLSLGLGAFAGWEDEHRLCNAVIGAEAYHPAARALVDGLPAWMRRHMRAQPDTQTGPVYLTSAWKGRADVTLLPPVTFYPVGFGPPVHGPYPRESFAVHHWGASWFDAKHRGWLEEGRAAWRPVVIVPYRKGVAARDKAWPFVRKHLETLGWPIFLGDSDGRFNVSEARNRAAAKAGDWSVAYVVDADTLDDLEVVKRAAVRAALLGSAVVPWDIRCRLSKEATRRAVREGVADLDVQDDFDPDDPTDIHGEGGGSMVVSRAAWDLVGGYDEGFQYWGFEDVAFRFAINGMTRNRVETMSGVCWHLWHPPFDPTHEGTPEGYERMMRYRNARTMDRMRGLLHELRPKVDA